MKELPISVVDMADDAEEEKKYSHDFPKGRRQLVFLCKITFSIGCWYLFSILSTIVNKSLISGNNHVFPLTLTFAHVFISSLCDMINMSLFHRKELSYYIHNINLWMLVRYVAPLAIAMVATKILTYISYGYIPASLTHTIKALQPFFNVLIVFIWTGEGVDSKTILSLFPIVLGVAYASVNELEFNLKGFISALISTVVGVWQSVYLKMLMRMGMEQNFIHWCNGTVSCLMLLPIVLIYEYSEGSWRNINFSHLLLSSAIQYLSSVSSYYTMSLVTSLSYSICSTFKRVTIIVASVFYFGKMISLSNLLGIVIASMGAIFYNFTIKRSGVARKSPELKANRELSYMDLKTITL